MASRCSAITASLLLLSLITLNLAQTKRDNKKTPTAARDCSTCPDTCPELTTVCPAGTVKDVCDCCLVCARKEGEACDIDVINDERQFFQKPFYKPVQGRCGDSLKCVWQKDEQAVTDYASCICKDHKAVCGEDGKTYKNKCVFSETMAGRREQFRIVKDEPCDQAPTIISAPQSLEENEGQDVILSCEVAGFPTPKIEWTLTRQEDGLVISLPNDDMRKSVQSRGGPDHHQASSWLQLQALENKDAGVYSCIARNKLGKAEADATLSVTRKNEL